MNGCPAAWARTVRGWASYIFKLLAQHGKYKLLAEHCMNTQTDPGFMLLEAMSMKTYTVAFHWMMSVKTYTVAFHWMTNLNEPIMKQMTAIALSLNWGTWSNVWFLTPKCVSRFFLHNCLHDFCLCYYFVTELCLAKASSKSLQASRIADPLTFLGKRKH